MLPGAECLRTGRLCTSRSGLEGSTTSSPQEGPATETLQPPGNQPPCKFPTNTFTQTWLQGMVGERRRPATFTGQGQPPWVPRGLGLIPLLPPTPGWAHGLFSLSRGESTHVSWVALLPGLGSTPYPQAALPWQRRDAGGRNLVSAPFPRTVSLHLPLPHLHPAPPGFWRGEAGWTPLALFAHGVS